MSGKFICLFFAIFCIGLVFIACPEKLKKVDMPKQEAKKGDKEQERPRMDAIPMNYGPTKEKEKSGQEIKKKRKSFIGK